MNIFTAIENQLPSNDGTWEIFIGMPDDSDGNFSPYGCGIIDGLACDVYTVNCALIRRNISGRIIYHGEYQEDVCAAVLDAMANGSKYYQDERGDWIPEYDFKYTA